MKLILLGTGTSTGVPEVGCHCVVCQSEDARDKRLRTSALLITSEGRRILIDCGPDFRQQALHIGLDRVDAILLTHEHYDHVYGLDDLRTIAWRHEIPIYGEARVLEAVRQRMHYVFSPNPYPGTPRLTLNELQAGQTLSILGLDIKPIRVMHGSLPIYGYRFHEKGRPASQDISYITDMKSISAEDWQAVAGSRLLIVNALRYLREHPSHQNVLDVQRLVAGLSPQPELTLLTHLSHYAPAHKELDSLLQASTPCISVGYDYQCLCLGEQLSSQPFEPAKPSYIYTRAGEGEELAGSKSLSEEESTLTTQLCDGAVLEGKINLSVSQYPVEHSRLEEGLHKALTKLGSIYRIGERDSYRYYQLRKEGQEPCWSFSLSINAVSRASHEALGSEAQSLAQLSGLDPEREPIDIYVVEAQMTQLLATQLRPLMGESYKSSLDKNY